MGTSKKYEDERVMDGGVGLQPEENDAGKAGRPRRRIPRWLVWGFGVMLVVLVAVGAAVAYVLHNAEPILRRRLIASLEERFRSPVELDELHISLLRGLQVTGNGLRILHFGGKGDEVAGAGQAAPMLAVKSFEFRTGLRALFEPTMRVKAVAVQGLELRIPPKGETRAIPEQDMKRELGKLKLSIRVDEIVCSDATLTIETNKPGKEPLVFAIRDLTLHDVGPGKAFPFDARVVNAKPVGEIHATGHFGPWQGNDPRETALDGDYSFTDADLGTIKGISGTLNSTGKFGGSLGEIGVTGTTDTPNFALDMSEHPLDLRTQFDATVDGTTGDTKLNHVHATLRHTVLDVSGTVARATDGQGVRGDPEDERGRDDCGPWSDLHQRQVAGYGGQAECAGEWESRAGEGCGCKAGGVGDERRLLAGQRGAGCAQAELPDSGRAGGCCRQVQPGRQDVCV